MVHGAEFDLAAAAADIGRAVRPSAFAVVSALRDDIAAALAGGATYRQIAAVLAVHGCAVKPRTIKDYRWTRRICAAPAVQSQAVSHAVRDAATTPLRDDGPAVAGPAVGGRSFSSVMTPKLRPRPGQFNKPVEAPNDQKD